VRTLYRLARPLLFSLDAERAHGLAARFLRLSARLRPQPALPPWPGLRQTVFGLDFPTPVGLAAGMDKGEVVAPAWFGLGFGFVEIGSITPRPQAGNPRPRLFRLIDHRAVINRMGFNNAGADAVAARLRALPRQPGPVGLNLGKNKDTPNERAAGDYVSAFRTLAPFADYVAINVSSPNTPGLRALQQELGALVRAVAVERDALPRRVPLLVKLSPDESQLESIAAAAVDAGADGIIATNTTVDRSAVAGHPRAGEAGGLSGAPLRQAALRACARLHLHFNGRIPLIGVGGIFTAEDAYARIRAGASLIQVYTALVYEGPGVARAISAGLLRLLARDRLTLSQAIGRDAKELAG
jgi:dihydroorotate dehydrogenase